MVRVLLLVRVLVLLLLLLAVVCQGDVFRVPLLTLGVLLMLVLVLTLLRALLLMRL